ncbi:MAG: hypothetical protein HC824_20660 [Synechococcales cyanobacterium RM1_1_8]|nr:hypothetical protein [Synechococcales cyanobacterium RM1_1_8]
MRLAARGLAAVFALLFALVVPLQAVNVVAQDQEAMTSIAEQATQAEGQLDQAIAGQLEVERNRIQTLLKDGALLQEAIASGQLAGEQVALLQGFQAKPDSVETYLTQEAEKEKQRLLGEISDRRTAATEEVKLLTWKRWSPLPKSLLLAVGYGLLAGAGALLASRPLLITGAVLTLSAVVDYFFLLTPPNFSERSSQIGLANQFVDRGIVPLVGITLLLVGYWVRAVLEGDRDSTLGQRIATPAKLGATGLAAGLALLFLVIVPWQAINVSAEKKASVDSITEQATQAQGNLDQAVGGQLEVERNRIQALLKNDQLLQQAIASGQLQGEDVALLQRFQADPNAVETYLQEEAAKQKQRLTEEISTRRDQATEDAGRIAWKASSRTVMSSLLLAIAYGLLGWIGLKGL